MRKSTIAVAGIAAVAIVLIAGTLFVVLGKNSGGGGLDDVKVTGGDKPKVTVPKGLSVTKTTTRVLKQGSGDKVAENDSVKINYVAVNARTGKVFDDSFTGTTQPTITMSKTKTITGLVDSLVGQKVGTRLLSAVAPKDGAGLLQSTSGSGLKKTDTIVFLFDVISATSPADVPSKASGDAVDTPADVPTVELDGSGQPTGFKRTATTPEKVGKLAAFPVIKGKGPAITSGQTLTMQYVGATFKDLKVFQTSWTGTEPFTSVIGQSQLIGCWDKLIPGQTVGSRVILECPADDAYGESPSGGQPAGDLIFVVDLLAAS